MPLVDVGFNLLSISHQTKLLSISRSSYYYVPNPNLGKERIKTRLKTLYAEYPFLGSRRLSILLKQEGYKIGRRGVSGLMRILGLRTLYPHKITTIPNKKHKKYPYLLNELEITHANQVCQVLLF